MKSLSLGLLTVALLLFGCDTLGLGAQKTATPTTNTTVYAPNPLANDIDNAILLAGKLKDEVDSSTSTPLAPKTEGDYKTYTTSYSVVDSELDITNLGNNDEVIWPGALLRGDKINKFVYSPIIVDRAPLTLSVNLESAPSAGELVQVVEKPMLSNVRTGIKELLKKAILTDTEIAARGDFFRKKVSNTAELNAALKANVEYGPIDLKSSFNFDSSSKTTKVIATYKQLYYTINIDPPKSPSSFLANTLTEDQALAAFPAGSYPVYVSGVTYGMMAVVCVESNETEEKLQAALDVTVKLGGDDQLTSDLEIEAKKTLSAASVKVLVYGGKAQGLNEIETGYDGFVAFLKANKTFTPNTPGVPLSYKFSHLRDNTLAMVALTSQWSETRVIKVKQPVRIQFDKMVVTAAQGGWGVSQPYASLDDLSWKVEVYNSPAKGLYGRGPAIYKRDVKDIQWHTSGYQKKYKNDFWNEQRPSVTVTIDTDPDLYNSDEAVIAVSATARDWHGSDPGSDVNLSATGEIKFKDLFTSNTQTPTSGPYTLSISDYKRSSGADSFFGARFDTLVTVE